MSRTTVVLVADIFGKTPALAELSQTLNDATIVDPYDGNCLEFSDEANAYQYFSQYIGLEKYLLTLSAKLSKISGDIVLIGFSIGASTIWLYSNSKNAHQNSKQNIVEAICFYGSQIRNHVEVTPNFPCQLIFPHQENHFNVDNLLNNIKNTKNVLARKCKYSHGFMNILSKNYNNNAYQHYQSWLSDKCV